MKFKIFRRLLDRNVHSMYKISYIPECRRVNDEYVFARHRAVDTYIIAENESAALAKFMTDHRVMPVFCVTEIKKCVEVA